MLVIKDIPMGTVFPQEGSTGALAGSAPPAAGPSPTGLCTLLISLLLEEEVVQQESSSTDILTKLKPASCPSARPGHSPLWGHAVTRCRMRLKHLPTITPLLPAAATASCSPCAGRRRQEMLLAQGHAG